MTLLRAGLSLAAILAAVSIACSSEEGDGPPTAEEAAAIVAAALLEESDLPDASWTMEETDLVANPDPEDEENPLLTAEGCAALNAVFDQIDEASEVNLADLQRDFTQGDEAQFQQTNIASNVFVPDPAFDIEATFEDIREAFALENVQPCFEESLPSLFGGEEAGITVNEVAVADAPYIAEGGIGIMVDMDAIAVVIPLKLHLEMHLWPSGDAVGSLIMMDLNTEIVSANSQSIVETAETRLADAVEAN